MDTFVYMDYHATTPVDPRVMEAMLPYFTERFGNPASRQHRQGWVAGEAVERARASVARTIGAAAREVVFTSGATEANNLALKGMSATLQKRGDHIITVRTEHNSVLDVCRKLEKNGFRVTYLDVDGDGLVDPGDVAGAITGKTILVSVMLANNEIGTLQPVGEIGAICRSRGVAFHTDATQAVGKIPVDVGSLQVDLLAMSAHKVYGPKGVGFLYIRRTGSRLAPVSQIDGGGHEGGLRSGTLNVPGIVGCARALELAAAEMEAEGLRLSGWRDEMLRAWETSPGDVRLNGHPTRRLPNNLNVSFPGVEDNLLMMNMKDVAVSTGSACSSSKPEPSHVLSALGLPRGVAGSAIRFGLGRFTTEEEVRYVTGRVAEEVMRLRELRGMKGAGARNRKISRTPSTTTTR
ncbi:MAG TPA: cysteine desulfurase family protein [Bacteroidota bacterium]|nr:cysteine desulfurase family protein [Bacteroidota bacterium]